MSIEGDKARNLLAQLRPYADAAPALFKACDDWVTVLDKRESALDERDRATSVAHAEAAQARAEAKTSALQMKQALATLSS